jgi:hypothetical protein
MNFINLTKSFSFDGMRFQFSYYDADNQSSPDFNIIADNESGRLFLSSDENYDKVSRFVLDTFIIKGSEK